MTTAECKARREQAGIELSPGVKALKKHLSFMSNNPPASCFKDAYAADKKVARAWLEMLPPSGQYPGEHTGAGRATANDWDEQIARTNRFLSKLSVYFSDCG